MSIWKTIQHLAYFAGGDFKLDYYNSLKKILHSLEMIITGENNANCKNAQLLTKALEKYFKKIKLKFTEVKKIKPEPSGKRLLFKCLLKDCNTISDS